MRPIGSLSMNMERRQRKCRNSKSHSYEEPTSGMPGGRSWLTFKSAQLARTVSIH